MQKKKKKKKEKKKKNEKKERKEETYNYCYWQPLEQSNPHSVVGLSMGHRYAPSN